MGKRPERPSEARRPCETDDPLQKRDPWADSKIPEQEEIIQQLLDRLTELETALALHLSQRILLHLPVSKINYNPLYTLQLSETEMLQLKILVIGVLLKMECYTTIRGTQVLAVLRIQQDNMEISINWEVTDPR